MSATRLVARAQRAFRAQADPNDPFGHIKLTRELAAGNRYAHAKLRLRGLVYRDGAIVKDER